MESERTAYFEMYSLMVLNVYFVGSEVVRISNICMANLKFDNSA